MSIVRHDLLVILFRMRSVARFFIGLRDQHKDEWVVLISLAQVGYGRLVIAGVEGDISREVREEDRLVGIVCLVQRGLGRSDLLLCFVALSTTCCDAGLRI